MLHDFKAFIARGNVMGLAIGVIMGAAFTKIITTLTEKMIMPVVGIIAGKLDFTKMFINLSNEPIDLTQDGALDAAIKKGTPLIMYGQFISDVVNFLIVAFIMFLLARWLLGYFRSMEAAAPPTPTEALLAEIRDTLKTKQASV